WHLSFGGSVQTTGFKPVHMPLLQTSVGVHAVPSSHALPSNQAQMPSTVPPAAIVHASQGPPLHSVLQHTPSTQNPDRQSEQSPHGLPRAAEGRTISVDATALPFNSAPPATRTEPSASNVIVCPKRGCASGVAGVHVLVAGS